MTSTLSAKLMYREKCTAGHLTSAEKQPWPRGPPLFPLPPGQGHSWQYHSLHRELSLGSRWDLEFPGWRCFRLVFSVLPPVPVVSQLMSLYLGPSVSRTFPSLPSLGGIEGVCSSLKSNVEVRVKGEGQYVAALFRGQIHPFTHSFNYLLPPTVCLAY